MNKYEFFKILHIHSCSTPSQNSLYPDVEYDSKMVDCSKAGNAIVKTMESSSSKIRLFTSLTFRMAWNDWSNWLEMGRSKSLRFEGCTRERSQNLVASTTSTWSIEESSILGLIFLQASFFGCHLKYEFSISSINVAFATYWLPRDFITDLIGNWHQESLLLSWRILGMLLL